MLDESINILKNLYSAHRLFQNTYSPLKNFRRVMLYGGAGTPLSSSDKEFLLELCEKGFRCTF